MVFSSATFLFYFFPLFLFLYYLLPWKNGVLLAGSLLFYAWGEPRFVPLLMLSTVLNYCFGYAISRAGKYKKLLLASGVGLNLALLTWCKYIGFLSGLLNDMLVPLGRHVPAPEVLLPLGISFFTFQGISYLVDVYCKEVSAQKSFWTFAMYKAMFPQLIAGPIVRYKQIAADVDHRELPNARIWAGLRQFIVGLAQKVLIANTVAVSADAVFNADPTQLTATSAWLGIACYTIQILYDFAGYSNMAIGIGHMLGFTYPPNFNQPYSSRSVTEFWRRWHISLSSWFRDYLYIPLGGNRVAPWRTYLNLALVFLLCGMWHGAAWTFVVWGAWHGGLLVLERLGMLKWLERLPAAAGQVYTLFMVMIGWVFFRANDMTHAFRFLGVMFGGPVQDSGLRAWQMDVNSAALAALAAGMMLAVVRRSDRPAAPLASAGSMPAVWWNAMRSSPAIRGVAAFIAFLLCAASLAAGTYNPFIYFRF